jgi:hypothetical protein
VHGATGYLGASARAMVERLVPLAARRLAVAGPGAVADEAATNSP